MIRIKNKSTARKLFNEGKTIYLLPCKADIDDQDELEPISQEDNYPFDILVNMFELYKCDAEVGYYAHYYMEGEQE